MVNIKKILNKLFFLTIGSIVYGQNVGINTKEPQSTLHVKFDPSKAVENDVAPGIIAPVLKFSQLQNQLNTYGNEQTGLIVYISEIDSESNNPKTDYIDTPGYYYFDGMTFYGFAKSIFNQTINQPWYNSVTNTGATQVDQNIYQDGQVGIGKTGSIDPNAQLEITSTNKGLIIPRLTTSQRDEIINPTLSMMIWNTDQNCFNFYKSIEKGWKSICENVGEAEFTILDCQNAIINGVYIVGQAVNTTNYLQLTVNVTEKGTYNIEGITSLGLYFQRNGSFPNTGNYTIIIPAFGSPTTATVDIIPPQTNFIDITINNTPTVCKIPLVTIAPATVEYILDTNSNPYIIPENLTKGESSYNKKITVKLDVAVSGTTNLIATDQEGFNLVYNAYNQNLSTGLQEVVLYSNGATVPNSFVPNELDFKLEGLGFIPSNNTNLFQINLGTNEAIASCQTNGISVNGTYIAGKSLTTNSITVNLNVTKTGTYEFTALNETANIKFTASGSFTTLGPQTITAVASTITNNTIGLANEYNMSATFNGQSICNFNLNIIYPSVNVLLFGTNSIPMEVALKNTSNFGPEGKFKVEALTNSTTLNTSALLSAVSLKNYINTQGVQIIVLPVGMNSIPTDAQQVLADFIKLKKGVVIYTGTVGQEANISGIINKLFPGNTINYNNTTYNVKAAMLPYITDQNNKSYPYIKGPFDQTTNGLGGKYFLAQAENSWFGVTPETLPTGLNTMITMPQITTNTSRAVILYTDKPGLFVMPTYAAYLTPNTAYGLNNPISANTAAWGALYALSTNSISTTTLAPGSIIDWVLMGNILSESIKHIYNEYDSTIIID